MQRIRQGVRALLAFTRTVDYELAAQYLSPAQLNLFRQMTRSEQLHSLNVLRDVLAQADQTPHDLAVVALLHDVGKIRYRLGVPQKTISVLVKKFLPRLDDWFCAEEALVWWRAPFQVRRYHPKWSGELLATAGSSERVVWLATHHQEPAANWRNHPHYDLLQRLQQADDSN